MVINWRQNKLIGPGGGTRRLHHKYIKGNRMQKIKDIIKIAIGLEIIVILAFLCVLMCSYAPRNGTKRHFHRSLAREIRANQIVYL